MEHWTSKTFLVWLLSEFKLAFSPKINIQFKYDFSKFHSSNVKENKGKIVISLDLGLTFFGYVCQYTWKKMSIF